MAVTRTTITILIFLISFNALARHRVVDKEPSIWLYNQTSQQIVWEQNSTEIRPFASITKLMTAMIAVDYDWNFERRLRLSGLATSHLPPGTYTRSELLQALLVKSDNASAETLAADYPGGRLGFLQAMNQRAWQLGMYSTQFQDPSGLDRGNISNARDLGTMVLAASAYSIIRDISVQPRVAVETRPKKFIQLNNTNGRALFLSDNIKVSKSGFTNPAGFCMALAVERLGQTYSVIVLGAKNSDRRLDLVKNLLYNHIAEGQDDRNSDTNRRPQRKQNRRHE